ncbi:MAG: hypothetical protein FJW30_05555 [Acidobacteria bacterium]|nr:hypothetical protein [Acidobacteriota bacterium]
MAVAEMTPKAQWARVTWNDLKELAKAPGPCVTIVAPIDRTRPGPVRMDALAGEAAQSVRQQLLASEWSEARIAEYLRPLEIVLNNVDVPPVPAEGIALFHSRTLTRWFPIPAPREAAHFLGARFVMDSVCRALLEPPEFVVLLLARKHIRALRVQPGAITRLDAPFGDIAPPEPAMKALNATTAGPRGARVQFGTSVARDQEYRILRNLYGKADRALRTLLHGEHTPVVLAGIAPEVAMFREITNYPHVSLAAVLTSGDGGETDVQLARKALVALSGWRSDEERRVRTSMQRAAAARKLNDSGAIIRAASNGHVRALLFRGEVTGPDDGLNVALAETLKHGGSVWPTQAAHEAPMQALLRYRPGAGPAPASA